MRRPIPLFPSRLLQALATLLGISLFLAPAIAAEGDLDSTFGTNGRVLTDFRPGETDYGYSVALQDDGKIVVAGFSNNGGDNDFAVARYKSDGTLDATFGTNGIVTTDISPGNDDAGFSVALQDDGKIVVAGALWNGDRDFVVARYKSDGALDTSFGTNGIVVTDITPGKNDIGYSVALQDDGKILVAGVSFNGSDDDFAVARYKSDGTLDATFGTNGIVTTGITPGEIDHAYFVALQDDGKIVVSGHSVNGLDQNFAVVRYKSDGALDTTFGANGIVTTDVAGGVGTDSGRSIALQDDGKILVAGYSHDGSDYDFAVVRYKSNGALDSTFGTNGRVKTGITPGERDQGYSVALQADGMIVVAGLSNNGSDDDFAVARYKSNGALNTSFGTNGRVITDITPGETDGSWSVALQDDGKILVAGYSNNGSDMDFAVARYIGDETTPEVIATTPIDGATDQALNTPVTAEFNDSMDDATITGASFTLSDDRRAAISGTVTYDDDTHTATFTPDSDLESETTYTATLSTRITDKAGNALDDDNTWSFTTRAASDSVGEAGDGGLYINSVNGCDMGGQGNAWAWLLLAAGMVAILARRGRWRRE